MGHEPFPRSGQGMAVYDIRIYFFAGYDGKTHRNDVPDIAAVGPGQRNGNGAVRE